MTENEKINGWTFEETVKNAENLMEAESNMFKWDVLRHLRDFLENYKDELEQYRAIGTVEEVKEAKEQFDDINSVAEKTALIGLSDYGTAKEAVITEMKRNLDYSLKEYQSIGTVEEFKALKEKNEPKKIDIWANGEEHCPFCDKNLTTFYGFANCFSCGQKLDWQ